MKPGDVEVPFPVGTSVIDVTQKISYLILPDNHYKLSAFADPVARLIYMPPENRIVDRIDDSVRKLFVAIPLGTTDRRPNASPSQ